MQSFLRRCLAFAAILAVCGCGAGTDDPAASGSNGASDVGPQQAPGAQQGPGAQQAPRAQQGPSAQQGGGATKVVICHIPPGNPANAHTITVGAPAVPAHLKHGDLPGTCPDDVGTSGVIGTPGGLEPGVN